MKLLVLSVNMVSVPVFHTIKHVVIIDHISNFRLAHAYSKYIVTAIHLITRLQTTGFVPSPRYDHFFAIATGARTPRR